jgi:AraC family transcriptional regulator
MVPRIKTIEEKKLVGNRLTMSFANYTVVELWKIFLPKQKDIKKRLTNDLFSLAIYQSNHFANFRPTNEFERWAAVEVVDYDKVPSHMETFTLEGGLYAVFDYVGLHSDNSIFHYIYGTWLPTSDYLLDDRPHFEVLGEKYKNSDPASEEEIWIPIRSKANH